MNNSNNILKIFVLLAAFAFCPAFAVDSDEIPELTDEQKSEIDGITAAYTPVYELSKKNIAIYNDKAESVKNDEDKTDDQKQLLMNAYRRTIEIYEKQIEQTKQNINKAYEKILTPSQFEIYEARTGSDDVFIKSVTEK